MVLGELGGRITQALRALSTSAVIDEEVFNKILKDISSALLQSDVNIKVVMKLRDNIKLRVNLEEVSSGTNKRKLIQRAVFEELVSMLTPEGEPYVMEKGRANVVMFVGLQVRACPRDGAARAARRLPVGGSAGWRGRTAPESCD